MSIKSNANKQNIGGVQSWSVGAIYPYHVVIRSEGEGGVAYAQGPAGKLTEYAYTSVGQFVPSLKKYCGGDFQDAHRKAEAQARFQLGIDSLLTTAAQAS